MFIIEDKKLTLNIFLIRPYILKKEKIKIEGGPNHKLIKR